jgi:thioredoxin reductase (NADPH)
MTEIKTDIAIIGAGPAGLSAAIYTARAKKKTVVLKGKTRSRMEMGHIIENYPGVGPMPGSLLLQNIEKQARGFGAQIIEGDALALNLESDPKLISTRNELIEARAVLLAMGKGEYKKRIINEDKFLGRGLSYCAVCDGAFYRGKRVAVYGIDSEAADNAKMLAEMGCDVTLVLGCRNANCTERLGGYNIRVIDNAEITGINGEESITDIIVKKEGLEQSIQVSALFIIADVPSDTLLKDSGIQISHKDCISVNRNMETNIPGVYAAGDITCGGMQASIAAGEGVSAALSALKFMRESRS